MSAFKDLSGQRFGRYVALARAPGRSNSQTYWYCRCDCGNERSVNAHSLRRGTSTSCGCFARENISRVNSTHGKSRTPEYSSWRKMLNRCGDQDSKDWDNYGARGIGVCNQWKNSFEEFLSDVGLRPTPTHSIDRFPNQNGDYEPGNVRWATQLEQANNTRANRIIVVEGERLTIGQAMRKFGLMRHDVIKAANSTSSSETATFIGAQMMIRHAQALPFKPDFVTFAQDNLSEAERVLEVALQKVREAMKEYSSKTVAV